MHMKDQDPIKQNKGLSQTSEEADYSKIRTCYVVFIGVNKLLVPVDIMHCHVVQSMLHCLC